MKRTTKTKSSKTSKGKKLGRGNARVTKPKKPAAKPLAKKGRPARRTATVGI